MQTHFYTSLKKGSISLEIQQFVQSMNSRGLPGTSASSSECPQVASGFLELVRGLGVPAEGREQLVNCCAEQLQLHLIFSQTGIIILVHLSYEEPRGLSLRPSIASHHLCEVEETQKCLHVPLGKL